MKADFLRHGEGTNETRGIDYCTRAQVGETSTRSEIYSRSFRDLSNGALFRSGNLPIAGKKRLSFCCVHIEGNSQGDRPVSERSREHSETCFGVPPRVTQSGRLLFVIACASLCLRAAVAWESLEARYLFQHPGGAWLAPGAEGPCGICRRPRVAIFTVAICS